MNKLIVCFGLILFSLMNSLGQNADVIYHNGPIYTADDTTVEAVATKGNKIIAVGTKEEVFTHQAANTELIDLEGKFLMPAFIEGHGHFSMMGNALLNLDFSEVRTWQEVVDMVEAKVKEVPEGTWIFGRGWHQEKLSDLKEDLTDGFPNNWALNRVSPLHPVVLEHANGHALIANHRAIHLAEVSEETLNPEGGEIQKNAEGRLTGMFLENGMYLIKDAMERNVDSVIEEEKFAQWKNKIDAATEHCYKNGVASFHDMGVEFEELEYYKTLSDEGKLGVRLNMSIWANHNSLVINGENYPLYDERGFFQVRSFKRMMDGALGSRGAWFIEKYDDADEIGTQVHSLEEITKVAALAAEKNMQLCVHAIGDKANQAVLDIMEEASKGLEDHRWRIEHAQHLDPKDIGRFAELGVIASFQSVHCTSDCGFVATRLGEERAKSGAYMWRSLIDSGAMIANGTDVPIEALSPIENIYSALTRKGSEGIAFYPEQVLTRDEALKSYTIFNAKAGFLEDKLGSIAVGKLADIVVLSKNLLEVPVEEIPSTKVLTTVVDGQVKYSADGN